MKKKNNEQHYGHSLLNTFERSVYWIVWFPLTLYPFYVGYTLSIKYELDTDVLVKGWFTYYKDIGDYEWNFWWNYSYQFSFIFSLYSLGGVIITNFHREYFQYYCAFVSIILVGFLLSIKGVLIVLCHCLLLYLVLLLKNQTFMWLWSLAGIYSIITWEVRDFQLNLLNVDLRYSDVVQYGVMISYIRCLSYGCKLHDDKEKGFWKYLCYVLYLPLFFNGPILTFDLFSLHLQKETKIPFQDIFKDILTVVSYSIGLNICFHLIYAPSISKHINLLERFSAIEAASLAWIFIVIFCIKYYIFYRFAGIFVKLNGFVPPGPPKCIASLYTFVDMWRYFDKGLYRFLQQCIYIPVGGSRHGLVKQSIASLLCFCFVGFWHGNHLSSWYWALSNWFCIVLEAFISLSVNYLNLQNTVTGPMYRRLCAVGGSFSIFALIYCNMIFLCGFEVANVLVWRILADYQAVTLILFILYCSAQCSIDVNYCSAQCSIDVK